MNECHDKRYTPEGPECTKGTMPWPCSGEINCIRVQRARAAAAEDEVARLKEALALSLDREIAWNNRAEAAEAEVARLTAELERTQTVAQGLAALLRKGPVVYSPEVRTALAAFADLKLEEPQ